ncbi:hypothetical protein [Clostridium tagluense]|uniref:hypothetical protein n=1 Tax=Clostridium tagluense TaxID=360422 RepID=UPI001CF2F827|nr:hypothetical protein [Clostridium tagluense]MCB2300403.1 hypothetical protein [Clostridium tagluense]
MGLPKYIINFDELANDLKKMLLNLINAELDAKYPQLNTDNVETMLEEIKELMPSVKYEGLKKKIEALIHQEIEGAQKAEGRLLDIPPVIQENKAIFKFNEDVLITGLHFNQTGWKKEDKFSLEIDKNKIIEGFIKEIGEHKHFNNYFKVRFDVPIFFILHNNSGNSRQLMVDLEYLELPPPIIMVVMQWADGSPTDVDLHAIMEEKHVFWANRIEKDFSLDMDCVTHINENRPEILTMKAHVDKKLDIYANNFNGIPLSGLVSVKVYNKKSSGDELLKSFNVSLGTNRDILRGVCTIDLKTFKIVALNKNIEQ